MLECIALSTGYAGIRVSRNIDLSVREGEILTLIGPNGCGKTTLLKTLSGLLPPLEGSVLLEGKNIAQFSIRELARRRAYLSQIRETPDLTAEALVAHGRFSHMGFSRRMTAHDRRQVSQAMAVTGIGPWRERRLKQLSGGQCQRAYLAMTVAQETPLLLWDEPTTYLDIHNRLSIMELAKELNRRGKTIVMTLHDLSDALTVSHRVCLMDETGAVCILDTPEAVFRSGEIDRVFSVQSEQVTLRSGRISYVFTPTEQEGRPSSAGAETV